MRQVRKCSSDESQGVVITKYPSLAPDYDSTIFVVPLIPHFYALDNVQSLLLAEANTAKHADTVRRISEELHRRHQCYWERLKAIDQAPLTNTHTSITKLRDHRQTGTLSKEHVAARSTPEPIADSGPVEGAGEFAARGGQIKIIEPKKAPVKRAPRLKQAIGHTDALDVKGNIKGNFRSAAAVRAVSKISETKDPLNADLDTENPEDGPSAPKGLTACNGI